MALAPTLLALTIAANAAPGDRRPAPSPAEMRALAASILDAFAGVDLVCLGERHGSLADAALVTAMIRNPRFAGTVELVMLEMANPVHQDLLDRWLVEGEELAEEELRRIWRDAGRGIAWETPGYRGILEALRDTNRDLPLPDRIRAVGGALPIDWSRVRTGADLHPWVDRRAYLAGLARRTSLAPRRKTLALFGAGHCERRGMGFPAALDPQERRRVWSVLVLADEAARRDAVARLGAGSAPAVLTVAGTRLAELPAGAAVFPGHAAAGATLGEVADALVTYGERADPFEQDAGGPALTREASRRDRLWREALDRP